MVLLGNWVVDARPLCRPGASWQAWASLLAPRIDPTGRTDTCVHSDTVTTFASGTHSSPPTLLIGEEWAPSLGHLASGRERKGVLRNLPDACGFKYVHLFLSLTWHTASAVAPAGFGPIKDGGFVPSNSHSRT